MAVQCGDCETKDEQIATRDAEIARLRERLNGGLRALWCAATAAGGSLRIGPSVVEDYPGDKDAWVTIRRDDTFGDLIVTAHTNSNSEE